MAMERKDRTKNVAQSKGRKYSDNDNSNQSTTSNSQETNSITTLQWLRRQWDRYDTMVNRFARQNDDTTKRALCLAFARSILDDKTTETILREVLFDITQNVTAECQEALGKDKVANTKTQMLFLLWSLPYRSWQRDLHETLQNYCSRNVRQPVISFRNFLGSTLRAFARYIVNPLADIIEPWM